MEDRDPPPASELSLGTGGFHRSSSNVAFARCALRERSLDIEQAKKLRATL